MDGWEGVGLVMAGWWWGGAELCELRGAKTILVASACWSFSHSID